MRINRKQNQTYRFNGHPYFHASSIFAVKTEELERLIKSFEAKLADFNDLDDKKWTARWLDRFRREFDKKRQGCDLKLEERRTHRVRESYKRELSTYLAGEGLCGCNS